MKGDPVWARICCSCCSKLDLDFCPIHPVSAMKALWVCNCQHRNDQWSSRAKTDGNKSRNVKNVKDWICRDLGALPILTPVYTWTAPAESSFSCWVVCCRKLQTCKASLFPRRFFSLLLREFLLSPRLCAVISKRSVRAVAWCVWSLTFDKRSCFYEGHLPSLECVIELWTHFIGVFMMLCVWPKNKYIQMFGMWPYFN